jgi:hypothetical protein
MTGEVQDFTRRFLSATVIDAEARSRYTIRIAGEGGVPMSVDALYQNQIRGLPVIERLRLAQLIMDELAESAPNWVVEASDAWSQQDLYDVRRASLKSAGRLIADGDEDAQPG